VFGAEHVLADVRGEAGDSSVGDGQGRVTLGDGLGFGEVTLRDGGRMFGTGRIAGRTGRIEAWRGHERRGMGDKCSHEDGGNQGRAKSGLAGEESLHGGRLRDFGLGRAPGSIPARRRAVERFRTLF